MVNFGIFGSKNKVQGTGQGVVADIAHISAEETATSLVYAYINTQDFKVALTYSAITGEINAPPLLYHTLSGCLTVFKNQFKIAAMTASLMRFEGIEKVPIKVDVNVVTPHDVDSAIRPHPKTGELIRIRDPCKSGINMFDTETLKVLIAKGYFKETRRGYLFSDDYKTAMALLGWKLNGPANSATYGIHSSKSNPSPVQMPNEEAYEREKTITDLAFLMQEQKKKRVRSRQGIH